MLLSKVKVVGHSMEPSIIDGQTVLVSSFPYLFSKPKISDIVVLKKEKYIIKRITKIRENKIFVVGDNKKDSTDSRKFGWVDKNKILGKVILKI